MKTARAFLFIPLLLATSGCIHHRSGIPGSVTTSRKPNWKCGVTTRQEVVMKWGNPHKISGSDWIWRETFTNGGKMRASYYMIGFTVSNTAMYTREHHLTFGPDGKLITWETLDSVTDGRPWSIWPW